MQGYDEQDHDLTDKGLTSPAILNLDLDFSKLARDLPRPKKDSGGGGRAVEEEESELGGLC